MAEYTFKEFQTISDDAACLKRIMQIQYGGEETHCRFATSGRNFIR